MTIEIRDLTKTFGDSSALESVSFSLERGRPLAIVGRNGAGKTTLMRILLGLETSTRGAVMMPTGITCGYLPEDRGVYPSATVREHLNFFGRVSGVVDVRRNSETWLERMGLTGHSEMRLRELSKGNAQKLQLALSLIDAPTLAILDEPFAGLDPVNREVFRRVIEEQAADGYVLLSGHQLEVIEDIAVDVAVLHQGRLLAHGSLEAIRRDHGSRSVRLFGSPDLAKVLAQSGRWDVAVRADFINVTPVPDYASFRELLAALPEHCDPPVCEYRYAPLADIFRDLVAAA